jgi:beta propeller repeat protein
MPGHPTASSPEVQMSVQTGQAGWVYTKLSDPSQGLLKLLDVVRADGVRPDPNNCWVQEGLDANYQKTFTLHLLDYRAAANTSGTYKLVYTKPADDTTPPTTKLLFDGPATGTDPTYSITPATRIILLATDNDGGSGVDQMFKKVVGVAGSDTDFVPAYPFTLDTPGTYTLQYYSKDRAGNTEAVKTATIVVDSGAPSINTFHATPATIMPYAPRGIAAARTTNFTVKATDDQSSLQATIEIAKGTVFAATGVVRTLKAAITKNVESSVLWDGKDSVGTLVPTGTYTVRLSVTDGLDSSTVTHTATSTITVTVADWFVGQPLDPNIAATQQHPKISGTRVVWQDNRSGNWQIYTRDTAGTSSTAITNSAVDHQYPAISGNIIVWQDNRNNNWDIYGYDLSKSQEFVICNEAGNQERPVIAGDWVAWQDDRNGNWDIFAYNLTTHEQIQVTNHVRDQMHPAIYGTTLTWEDYRFGLGEVFTYDLVSRIETRYTVDTYNQTFPGGSGSTLVWTDERNNQRDIYYSPAQNNQVRVTYGTGDHSQATIQDHVIVYTDYEAGANDPNLAFYDTTSGVGALLTANPARQEEPGLGTGVLVWQDDRDGISQIYWSNFQVEAVPISADIKPGLNLIAVGDKLVTAYPTTSALIAAKPNGINIDKIVVYNSQNSIFLDTSMGADISLQKGMAIGLYATASGTLDTADSTEAAQYTLYPGLNYVGMLSIPNGYTSYSMLQSIGYDYVQSVRRFNNQTGAWETASIREVAGVKAPAGANFALRQGDGLIIVMKSRVDGWKP